MCDIDKIKVHLDKYIKSEERKKLIKDFIDESQNFDADLKKYLSGKIKIFFRFK